MRNILRTRQPLVLWAFALLALGYSFYIALEYASQPPLDVHAFRQTQTALTSYWFTQLGWQLAYETPVGGAPWSIPFEFPIYQAIVAFIAKVFSVDLNATGRLVSYAFLALTVVPVVSITRRLRLPQTTCLYFCAILFSMPTYVYWGRTFMMETAALFFSIAAVKFFLDYLLGERNLRVALAFILFATLAVLQKATTVLPMFAVLGIAYAAFELKSSGKPSMTLVKRLLQVAPLFLVPVAIGYAWVSFTDNVKMNNPLGRMLTSAALTDWNWGTWAQRFSAETWTTVMWERVLTENLGAWLGLVLLLTPLLVRMERSVKHIVVGVLALGLLPIVLFPMLHRVHNYYQTAIDIFFAYAVAITLAVVVAPNLGKRVALLVLAILMVSNYVALNHEYLHVIKAKFGKEDRSLAIGNILKRELPPEMQFVAFGNNWSSTLAYMSERKSLTAPMWLRDYDQVVSNPEKFVDPGRLGAVVYCPADTPDPAKIFTWAENRGDWKVGESNSCFIATPEKQVTGTVGAPVQSRCHIDTADLRTVAGKQRFVVYGWMAEEDGGPSQSDIVLQITGKNRSPIYLQTLKVPRQDVSQALKVPDDIDLGFSRIVENRFEPGQYEITLMRDDGQALRACGSPRTFDIP